MKPKTLISGKENQWNIGNDLHFTFFQNKAWNVGTSTTNNNVNFRMTNAAYNGAQTAGTIFINPVGFNVNYPVTNVAPNITAVLFNGVNICTSSGSKFNFNKFEVVV